MKTTGSIEWGCLLLAGMFFWASQAQAAPPAVSYITVTDVTPAGFTVTWNSSVAGQPAVRIFTGSNGTGEVTASTISVANPLKGAEQAVRQASQSAGVMQVQVSGLTASTQYYVQTVTLNATTGESTYAPVLASLPGVTTMSRIEPAIEQSGSALLSANDQVQVKPLRQDGSTVPAGTVVAVQLPGSAYPVTGVVGDGIEAPYACIDLNNAFDSATTETIAQQGGVEVTATVFLGSGGVASVSGYLMPVSGLARIRPTFALAESIKALQIAAGNSNALLNLDYDTNDDNRIGMPDALYFIRTLGAQ